MAANDPVEIRIEKMAEWAKGVEAQLKDLNARIVPTDAECDVISAELGALYEKYALVRDDAREARNTITENDDKLKELKKPITRIEAQASLDAVAINPLTEKIFTAPQCAARAKVALGENEEYQKLLVERRRLERLKAGAKALLADAESAFKEYGYRKDALKSRLDNLTARMGR